MEVNEEDSDEVRTTKSKDKTDDGPTASCTPRSGKKTETTANKYDTKGKFNNANAGNLILQKDDIIVKGINGTLFIAPCKLKIDVPKPTKLISGIIDQFKIEK
uniref:Profilin n=1 Tax=Loa loa TaxID=7209 RepID=A0A1I7VZB9_LOALO